jgi:hypothetical protein
MVKLSNGSVSTVDVHVQDWHLGLSQDQCFGKHDNCHRLREYTDWVKSIALYIQVSGRRGKKKKPSYRIIAH